MRYKIKYNIIFGPVLMILLWSIIVMSANAAPRLQDVGDKLVIVIDPGHGGENMGTIAGATPEKQMTFATAEAMYRELLQFDNVEVHMTRFEDKDLTLKERAEFAKSVDADFLFSLHYNASEYHTLFGSEVWVSCVPEYNAYGYQFGYLQMQAMKDMGLFLRGVKTRINDEGTDYYGIIRESAALSVPAVIIEYCHVDEERDIPFCELEEDWITFGQSSAHTVAKYFGLSSNSLGIDYSEESNQLPQVAENRRVQSTLRDETSPDVCMIELLKADYDTGQINIKVTATDYDSPLMYYDYSIDGGKTYCPLTPWPGLDIMQGTYQDTFTLPIKVASGVQPEIIFRAYNHADLYLASNSIPFLQTFFYEEQQSMETITSTENNSPSDRDRHSIGTTTFMPANTADIAEKEDEVSIITFLKICLVVVVILFSTVLIAQTISYQKRKKRRRQRIKEVGNIKNHNK